MLDEKWALANLSTCQHMLAKKHFKLDADQLQKWYQSRQQLRQQLEQLQQYRNELSKQVGMAKAKQLPVDLLLADGQQCQQELEQVKLAFHQADQVWRSYWATIPNLPYEDVPAGKSEEDNVCVSTWGKPSSFDFPIRDHVDLGEQLGMMDFGLAAQISGSRFCVLRADLAKLERVLAQWMLDTAIANGYQELSIPLIVHERSLFGTGQLPKFEEDQFRLTGDQPYYLGPTAEVAVTNMIRESILSPEQLPLKWVCHSPCFRREAGAYGRDTRGLIRQHQFYKVELVEVVHPDHSWQRLEALTACAEQILQQLKLPYRKMRLCGGDLGFASSMTYDLEVWLPSQQCYREISSCSNMTDFQARRMQARVKGAKGSFFPHTLNGSALAVGRTLVAILENYQQADGSVIVPEVLRTLFGKAKISLP